MITEIKNSEGKVVDYDFNLDPLANPQEVRVHLIELTNIQSIINAVYDNAKKEEDIAKLFVEEITEEVTVKLSSLSSPIAKSMKNKVNKFTVQVTIADEIWTIKEARQLYIQKKAEANKADLKVKELNNALYTTRSLLYWDKVEYINEMKGD